MTQPSTPSSPLAALPEDVKDGLLALIGPANECSSIFLKETHEQWEEGLIAAIEVGDVDVIQSMLDGRMVLASEALGVLLAEPSIPLDLDNLGALFEDVEALGPGAE
jgi:hypothetical protein